MSVARKNAELCLNFVLINIFTALVLYCDEVF